MVAVAEGGCRRVLAGAHGDAFLLGHGIGNRFEVGAGMGAVAPGLVLRASAGTPPVGAGFKFKDGGDFRGDLRLAHTL